MTLPILIAFFVVALLAYLTSALLAAEIKWVRPDLGERIPKPWLFSGYVSSLLELARELRAEDSGDRYRKVGILLRALRVLQGIEWALLAAFFVLLLLHAT